MMMTTENFVSCCRITQQFAPAKISLSATTSTTATTTTTTTTTVITAVITTTDLLRFLSNWPFLITPGLVVSPQNQHFGMHLVDETHFYRPDAFSVAQR